METEKEGWRGGGKRTEGKRWIAFWRKRREKVRLKRMARRGKYVTKKETWNGWWETNEWNLGMGKEKKKKGKGTEARRQGKKKI